VKVKVGDFLCKFMKLGSTRSAQLPDLGLKFQPQFGNADTHGKANGLESWPTSRGLVTFYVLFFILPESRRVEVAGITSHPNEAWMVQIARPYEFFDHKGVL
jgi:hypothetical protein